MSSRRGHKQQAKPNAKQRLRIIGGRWRGRKLAIADVKGLRPTGDRIRETLFNWLMHDMVGAACLDLFAGSGALSFESLSRGAATAVMLEQHPVAARQLIQHSHHLQAAQATVIQQDALRWLTHSGCAPASIDIVFIDPPFADHLWQASIDSLVASQLLKAQALVYIEAPRGQTFQVPGSWALHRHKSTGQLSCCLYKTGCALSTF
ncbi:MAG: 16S rRNA (guanine(966)-N(2))-methyltransferase RsmD [Cellvibrionaceae bacterium]|nr:16S rRNA (guanine(966)-N(2))-methyltransferase RsmD [Cellvibrionaceae bacterium]